MSVKISSLMNGMENHNMPIAVHGLAPHCSVVAMIAICG